MTKKSEPASATTNGKEEADMSQNFDQNLDEFRKAINFGNTYPVGGNSSPNATIGAGPTLGSVPASNLQQVVSQTLQGVLGRSFKPGDTESFKAALDVSFEVEEKGGKDVFTHVPRAYPAVGATDLGAGISGAQYSLVSFAKGLHEQTQPLLRNLHSLNANVDDQDLEAVKAIFTTAWDEFIAELSREGGPRASRADELAESIYRTQGTTVENGKGHLTDLGNQLGVVSKPFPLEFDRSKVVTREEEGFLTNFIALADYYFAVAQAWTHYRATFGKDLGTGLLLIERVLAVVSAAVSEVYAAMDSVSIDQHERLVIALGRTAPLDALTIEDLLSWISAFASREAPQLIRDGGKRGIAAIIPTAKTLKERLGQFVAEIKNKDAKLPSQLNHDRVLNPLNELEKYLDMLQEQATKITT